MLIVNGLLPWVAVRSVALPDSKTYGTAQFRTIQLAPKAVFYCVLTQ